MTFPTFEATNNHRPNNTTATHKAVSTSAVVRERGGGGGGLAGMSKTHRTTGRTKAKKRDENRPVKATRKKPNTGRLSMMRGGPIDTPREAEITSYLAPTHRRHKRVDV